MSASGDNEREEQRAVDTFEPTSRIRVIERDEQATTRSMTIDQIKAQYGPTATFQVEWREPRGSSFVSMGGISGTVDSIIAHPQFIFAYDGGSGRYNAALVYQGRTEATFDVRAIDLEVCKVCGNLPIYMLSKSCVIRSCRCGTTTIGSEIVNKAGQEAIEELRRRIEGLM